VLVNPGVAVPTKDVFAALKLAPGAQASAASRPPPTATLMQAITDGRNDMEAPAIALAPVIADVLAELRAPAGCRLARMSGSGATCFGLFDSARAATAAARALRAKHPGWWVRATVLGT